MRNYSRKRYMFNYKEDNYSINEYLLVTSKVPSLKLRRLKTTAVETFNISIKRVKAILMDNQY